MTRSDLIVQVPCLLGTLGLWAQGRKRRVAPALGFFSEVAWATWAIVSNVPGVIPWALLWASLYARTWLLWKPTSAATAAESESE